MQYASYDSGQPFTEIEEVPEPKWDVPAIKEWRRYGIKVKDAPETVTLSITVRRSDAEEE